MGDVDARIHIFAATALRRGRVTCPTLAFFTPGKASVLILQETEWTPGPVWTRRSEEKSLSHRITHNQTQAVPYDITI